MIFRLKPLINDMFFWLHSLEWSTNSMCVVNESAALSSISLCYKTIPKEAYIYTALQHGVCLCSFISLPCVLTRFLLYYEGTPKRGIQLPDLTGEKKKNTATLYQLTYAFNTTQKTKKLLVFESVS